MIQKYTRGVFFIRKHCIWENLGLHYDYLTFSSHKSSISCRVRSCHSEFVAKQYRAMARAVAVVSYPATKNNSDWAKISSWVRPGTFMWVWNAYCIKYCPFLRMIHRLPVDARKGLLMWIIDAFCVVSLSKMLNKRSSCRWFETSQGIWRHCNN